MGLSGWDDRERVVWVLGVGFIPMHLLYTESEYIPNLGEMPSFNWSHFGDDRVS